MRSKNRETSRQELKLDKGWRVQSSLKLNENGKEISRNGYNTNNWYSAEVPSTVMSVLIKNGMYNDIFFGKNLRSVPGMSYEIGTIFANQEMEQESIFAHSWWFRNEFKLPSSFKGKYITMRLKGINYRANIWINGIKVGDSGQIVGTFRKISIDVGKFLEAGSFNTIAIEVFPPKAKDLGITFVDWNPTPPDKNMGLWQDVILEATGKVRIDSPTVESKIYRDNGKEYTAFLTVRAIIRNLGETSAKGRLVGTINGARKNIKFSVNMEIGPNKECTISWPEEGQPLKIKNPKLWWPYQMGEPYLHRLSLYFEEDDGKISDMVEIRFGISEITSARTENDDLLLKVNGKPILVKGGGWAPDMFLRKNLQRWKDEFEYVKDLGLNTIRLEGKLEDDEFFQLADKKGIMIIAGWCCCDAWEKWEKWDQENIFVATNSLRDQLLRLRHHPSVILWMNGSDKHPPVEIERKYLEIEKDVYWNKPIVSSAKKLISELTGNPGVKMEGPYDYVPPVYWYVAKNIGGALGFNTETSSGPSIPTIEELKTFIPTESLWPIDSVWNYHAGGGPFRTIDFFYASLSKRYGSPEGLEDFVWKAQASNYESERAMFEAYNRERYKATGVVHWLLNNAWPSIIWHLYSYNLIGAGGYFGTKKALEPIHIQYSYDDRSIVVINSTYRKVKRVRAMAKAFDVTSSNMWDMEKILDLEEDSTTRVFKVPNLEPQKNMYFLLLKLIDEDGRIISENFYWLSTIEEKLDYNNTTYYRTPQTTYADFSELKNLPKVKLEFSLVSVPHGKYTVFRVELKNRGKVIAFLVRLRIFDMKKDKDIVPAFFDDNYFSILSGESKVINIKVNTRNLTGKLIGVKVDGFNVEPQEISSVLPSTSD
ncbi:MAG: glycosyl hydrolase family 2 [Nitrososphaerota archaeon]